VAAVDRALTLLDAVARCDGPCSLAELSEATGLYKSTILRLAASLERAGFLSRGRNGRFRLGPAAAYIGARFQRSVGSAEVVLPVMRELARESGESVAFYVPAGRQRLCLYRVESRHALRYSVQEGDILPLDIGSGGRVLAAHLGMNEPIHAAIRKQGYYHSDGERDPEVAGVSAPVFGTGGEIVGALTVAGPRHRLTPGRVSELISRLVSSAATLTETLGGRRRETGAPPG
jgi:DNA-binding IclR family transcriptional regulator